MNTTFIHNITRDMISTLHNNEIMQNIVQQLVDKLNKSSIIKPEHKIKIQNYFIGIQINPTIFNNTFLGSASEDTERNNLLWRTIIYFISDLNKYDYHLVNASFSSGLDVIDVFVLLLLNNIYDIEIFCKKNFLYGEIYYTIITLKKLSALYKLYHNY